MLFGGCLKKNLLVFALGGLLMEEKEGRKEGRSAECGEALKRMGVVTEQ